MSHPWERVGERVRVAPVTTADLAPLRLATRASLARISTWGPGGLDSIDDLVAAQGIGRWTFLVHARGAEVEPAAGHGVAARVHLNHPVGGRLSSVSLGYDAFTPYAGRGLTRAGLALVLDVCFAPAPAGLGLHRVEADVQPANVRSAGLLRALGFRREGHAPRLVHLPTLGDPTDAWRGHDRYAVLREDWPATAYPPHAAPRIACLVNGLPAAGKSSLGRRLAAELGLPYLGKDVLTEAFADALPDPSLLRDPEWQTATGAAASGALWALLADSPLGGVVETWAPPERDRDHVRAGLVRAGLHPDHVPEIFCTVPPALARARDAARVAAGRRHPVHRRLAEADWADAAAAAAPLGLGPVLPVDTTAPLSDETVCRLALQVRAHARCATR